MAEPTLPPYGVGDLPGDARREAPAAARNVAFIAGVLESWLPDSGLVLEVASGTGEHALAFARRFPALVWQPSDPDPLALASIAAWREGGPANLRPPIRLDVATVPWPVGSADAVLCINMVHISPWQSALGLIDGAAKLLPIGGSLILYGPWIERGVEPAASNRTFDAWLKDRDPRFGLRVVEDFAAEASARGLTLLDRRAMPANNLMLRFERQGT